MTAHLIHVTATTRRGVMDFHVTAGAQETRSLSYRCGRAHKWGVPLPVSPTLCSFRTCLISQSWRQQKMPCTARDPHRDTRVNMVVFCRVTTFGALLVPFPQFRRRRSRKKSPRSEPKVLSGFRALTPLQLERKIRNLRETTASSKHRSSREGQNNVPNA